MSGPTVAVVGDGVVGRRVRRAVDVTHRLVPRDLAADIVVLATPGPQAPRAADLVAAGTHVVCTAGALDDVREMLELDATARAAGASIVVGAAVSPGLSGLLARILAERLERCDELHIAVHGTAGPSVRP